MAYFYFDPGKFFERFSFRTPNTGRKYFDLILSQEVEDLIFANKGKHFKLGNAMLSDGRLANLISNMDLFTKVEEQYLGRHRTKFKQLKGNLKGVWEIKTWGVRIFGWFEANNDKKYFICEYYIEKKDDKLSEQDKDNAVARRDKCKKRGMKWKAIKNC